MAGESEDTKRRSDRTMLFLALVMAAGLLGILIYATNFGSMQQFSAIASVAIVMAGAAAVTGALHGVPIWNPAYVRTAAERPGTL
jgi:hypothetical protein